MLQTLTLEGRKDLQGVPMEIILSITMGIIGIKKQNKTIHSKSKYCRRSPLSTPNSEDE